MNACCVYDFTLHDDEITKDDVIAILNKFCKKWSFQQEVGTITNKKHFQGRFSLKVKRRLTEVPFKLGHLSPTSKANSDNMFYVTKEDTRIAGPWTNEDKVAYIPRQIRELPSLYMWQASIIDKMSVWDPRHINVVIDKKGNIGKSVFVGYCRAHSIASKIPMCNDFNKVMEMVMDMPTAKNYIFDFPRCISKDKLYGLYGAIEEVKNGYAYDTRYHFRDKVFDSPNIWIFTNEPPNRTYMSDDRWLIWEVVDNHLIKFRETTFLPTVDELQGTV